MSESEEKSSRSRRRRRASARTSRRRRLVLVGGLVAATAIVAAVVVVLVLFVFGDDTSDEDSVESLARRSIEALPAGEWPSLYDSFTTEFQQRCPRLEFNRAGDDAASQLGSDLPFLRFVRLENLIIEGGNARAEIVGEIAGQPEYRSEAAFLQEDGEWKLASTPGTEGCEAFIRPAN